nr:uncharacterized protein LOC113700796 [Coffea arabica]
MGGIRTAGASRGALSRGGSSGPTQARRVPSTGSAMTPQVTCRYCEKSNHSENDCWRKSGKCLACGSTEHQLANCPNKMKMGAKDGKVSQLEHVFIQGSKVRFMVIPDMLKNAPMFKRLEARIKGKGSALGIRRGRAVAMRARAQAAGRRAPPGRGIVPPVRR